MKWYESEPVEVDIFLPEKEPNLINGLLEMERSELKLKPLLKTEKKIEKDKKKEKKKNSLMNALSDSMNSSNTSSLRDPIYTGAPSYLDAFEESILMNEEEEDEFIDIVTQQKGKRKSKSELGEVKREFVENLDLLYNLLEDSKSFEKDLEKNYRALNQGKPSGRGISKYTTDMATAIISARSATLSIIKEINAVKRAVIDAQLKVDKSTKESENPAASNPELLGTNILSAIMTGYGRNNLMQNYAPPSGFNNYDDNDDELDGAEIGGLIESLKSGRQNVEHEIYNKRLEERLESEDSGFRSNEGNRYIEYESLEPRVVIRKDVGTGDWWFVAIDKDDNELPGYPIPNSDTIGKMTFAMDDSYATDKYGRSYKVFPFMN